MAEQNRQHQYKNVYRTWVNLAFSLSGGKKTRKRRDWNPLRQKIQEEIKKIDGYKNAFLDVYPGDVRALGKILGDESHLISGVSSRNHNNLTDFFALSHIADRGSTPGPDPEHHSALPEKKEKYKRLQVFHREAFINAVTSIVDDNLDEDTRVERLKQECEKRFGPVDENLCQLNFRSFFERYLEGEELNADSHEDDSSTQESASLPDPETSLELSWHIYGGRAMQLDELLPYLKLESFVFNNEIPPYVERETDKELRSKISEARMSGGQGLVVVRGKPKSGKTRSVFEALKKEFGGVEVWWSSRPESISVFRENLEKHNEQNPPAPLVIVLDDLNPISQNKDRLTWHQLEYLRNNALLVVIVHENIMDSWEKGLDNKVLDNDSDFLRSTGRNLYEELEKASVRQQVEFNDEELQDAQAYLKKVPRHLEIEKVDIRRYPEFLAAVPYLRKKIEDVDLAGTPDEVGHIKALIHALTDATIMYPSGINRSQLKQLTHWELEILPDGFYNWNPSNYTKATCWADKPVGSSTNKTHVILAPSRKNNGTYKLYDPLVQELQEELFQKRGVDTFDFLVEHLDEVEHDVVVNIARSPQVAPATRVIWMIRAALLGDKEARLWIKLHSFRIHEMGSTENMVFRYWPVNASSVDISSAVQRASYAALRNSASNVPLKLGFQFEHYSTSAERLLNLLEPLEAQYFESEDMIDVCAHLIQEVRGDDALKKWLKEKYNAGNIHAGFLYLRFHRPACGKRENAESGIFSGATKEQQVEWANTLATDILFYISRKDIESALKLFEKYLIWLKQIPDSDSDDTADVNNFGGGMRKRLLILISNLSDSQRYDFIEKSLRLLQDYTVIVESRTEICNLYLLLLIVGNQADDALSFVNENSDGDIDANLLVRLSQLLERNGRHDESFQLLKNYFNKHEWGLSQKSNIIVQMGITAKTATEQYYYGHLLEEIDWKDSTGLQWFISGIRYHAVHDNKEKAVDLLTKHPLYGEFSEKIGALDSNSVESLERWLHALSSAYEENADIHDFFALLEFGSSESKRYAQTILKELIDEMMQELKRNSHSRLFPVVLLLRGSDRWWGMRRPFWKVCEEDTGAKERMEEILNILDEVHGQYAEIEYARVYAYDALGETDKAMQCLSKAIDLNSPDALLLAWWLEEHGLSLTNNGSEDYLEKAVKAGSFEAMICMADKLLETDEADTIEDHIKACVDHYSDPI